MSLLSSDSGNDNSPIYTDTGELGLTRTQYTVKGIHKQTVDAMREAARHEGMKISSWVSVRLREAAERTLSNSDIESIELHELRNIVMETKKIVELNLHKYEEIQQELADLAKFQRTMMNVLVEKKYE